MDLIWNFQKLFFKRLKKDMNLPFHPKRFPFLLVVVKSPGISQKDIAKALNIEPPTVAITLKRMEKDGLITRRTDENDRRLLRVYPTKKAEDVFSNMKEKVTNLEKKLFSNLSDEERSCLEEVFKKLNDLFSRGEI